MKVGISATGSDFGARVDNRFGRCPWFLVVESDSLEFTVHENRHADEGMGAGIAAAQDLIDQDVDTVISGQVGPKAYEVLKASNIDIFLVSGDMSVEDAVERLKRGDLQRMEIRVF
jgi:predicted Fe-Mo cluster-binding NifX family protein